MEQSSSFDEITVMHQFDHLCLLVLKGEVKNYHKYMKYRAKHEVNFSELSNEELNSLSTMDEYNLGNYRFQVFDYDIEVKSTLIAEVLQSLTEKKRNVILLSYFMEMNDSEIARKMNLLHCTIREHRVTSLKLLKKIMEEMMDEAKE